jgi:hypothetical protein
MKITEYQRNVLLVVVAIAIGMVIYPPWVVVQKIPSMGPVGAYQTENPAGYALIIEPPRYSGNYTTVKLDMGRLTFQLMGLFVAGAAGFVIAGSVPSPAEKEAERKDS